MFKSRRNSFESKVPFFNRYVHQLWIAEEIDVIEKRNVISVRNQSSRLQTVLRFQSFSLVNSKNGIEWINHQKIEHQQKMHSRLHLPILRWFIFVCNIFGVCFSWLNFNTFLLPTESSKEMAEQSFDLILLIHCF